MPASSKTPTSEIKSVTIVCHHCGKEFETSPFSPQFENGCCDRCCRASARFGCRDADRCATA